MVKVSELMYLTGGWSGNSNCEAKYICLWGKDSLRLATVMDVKSTSKYFVNPQYVEITEELLMALKLVFGEQELRVDDAGRNKVAEFIEEYVKRN